MKIALDYDDTFTADPVLWTAFVEMAKQRMHMVVFVTYRYEPDEGISYNDDIKGDAEALGIDVIFTAGVQKAKMFDADIWIDDMPIIIPLASDLQDMYNGCVKNNDI